MRIGVFMGALFFMLVLSSVFTASHVLAKASDNEDISISMGGGGIGISITSGAVSDLQTPSQEHRPFWQKLMFWRNWDD